MSGPRPHPIRDEECAECRRMIANKRFQAALRGYTDTDGSKCIPYLAGSDESGTTVFFDEHLPAKISVRKNGTLKSLDPRPFLRIHETVEGVLIRLYGFDYAKAHRYATCEERAAVEAAGIAWRSYETALEPMIRIDEHDKPTNMPKNLLSAAYKGTKYYTALQKAA